jgi:sucrose-6-phosphate hydrolase SacC (GH32 family)
MAYSTDRGRTFTKYAKNPVLPHIIGGNRDPKVIWHAPTKKYVMALFKDQHTYAFFGSTTLTEWEWLSDYEFPNVGECPDLFELPVEGAPGETRWIFVSGNGSYFVGVFDGTKFTPESGPFPGDYGTNFYATQSYSGIPASDGRRIQIAWMNGGKYPDMAFNQQMSYPCALTLKRFPEGLIVCRQPVREIEKIYAGAQVIEHKDLNATDNPLSGVAGDLFSVRVTLAVSEDVKVVLRLRDADIVWTGKDKTLSCLGKSAPLSPVDGHIVLQGLLDRASLEVFGNDGRVSMSTCFLPKAEEKGLSLKAEQGKAVAERIEIHPLRSAWEQ